MTLEEAQAQILELKDKNAELETANNLLSQKNTELEKYNEEVRTLNQKYYERLIAQDSAQEENEDDDEPALSCVDFAKTLKI